MPTAQLSVRKIDARVVARLKARARRHGRSLESEVRHILDDAARLEGVDDTSARRQLAEHIRKRFTGQTFSDSTALIREDRDSR
jgi:plasmid stability protein